MKFSPTISLALALAAGMAAAAAAQTTASPDATTSPQPAAPSAQTGLQSGQANPTLTQQPTSAGQTQQQGTNLNQPNPNAPARSTAAQGQTGINMSVLQAQQQLQAMGLYRGPVDGIMDPDTRAAIANFHSQNGLQRTESLDEKTLARLQASRTAGSGSSAQGAAPAVPNAPAPTGAGGTATGQAPNR